jgi:hypothetical protein
LKAQTHSNDSKRVETSSSGETIDVEQGEQKGLDSRREADRELGKAGLTSADVAEQSAYESDQTNVAHQAANSDRNKRP